MKLLLLALIITLTSCSVIPNILPKDPTLAVDAQIGDTENKVKTGLGSLGTKETTTTTITDSNHVTQNNRKNKYHITGTGATVNVYETNYWLYAIFGLFIIGKPILRTIRKRHQRHNLYKHIASISTTSRTGIR